MKRNIVKSNCLIVAILVWLKDPLNTRIHMLWRPLEGWCPHFYWCHNGWYGHFMMEDKHLNGLALFWHAGKIHAFPYHRI